MHVEGHQAHLALQEWMKGEGADSVQLIRSVDGGWRSDGRWGLDVGEPPWELLRDPGINLELGEDGCARRIELRAAEQCAAALISIGEGTWAWMTSSRRGWRPGGALGEVLGCLQLRSEPEVPVRIDERMNRASTAAHDIRNQLSLALLRLERIESVADEELSLLRGTLRSGRALCNVFLEGAEPHADVCLRPILEEEVRGALDASGVSTLSVSLRCGARVYAHASETAIRRFVQNALSNALSISPGGAGLTVEVTAAGRGALELAVDDHGAGLSAEEVSNCFSFGVSGRGSTGMGSGSLLHAAEALGSELHISTGPGSGTRVFVRLRAAQSDRPVVVLLDRDPVLSERVRSRLEEGGWWVVCASGTEEAVGGLDRWGAKLAVTRRGACAGPMGAVRVAAEDLDVDYLELSDGDEGEDLPVADAPA